MEDGYIIIRDVKIEQNDTFEKIGYQLQQTCDKLIAIINGTTIKYYHSMCELPNFLYFDSKNINNISEQYYFKDEMGDTYCFFDSKVLDKFASEMNKIKHVKDKFCIRSGNNIYEFFNVHREILYRKNV